MTLSFEIPLCGRLDDIKREELICWINLLRRRYCSLSTPDSAIDRGIATLVSPHLQALDSQQSHQKFIACHGATGGYPCEQMSQLTITFDRVILVLLTNAWLRPCGLIPALNLLSSLGSRSGDICCGVSKGDLA